jgi:DUF1680 family protein
MFAYSLLKRERKRRQSSSTRCAGGLSRFVTSRPDTLYNRRAALAVEPQMDRTQRGSQGGACPSLVTNGGPGHRKCRRRARCDVDALVGGNSRPECPLLSRSDAFVRLAERWRRTRVTLSRQMQIQRMQPQPCMSESKAQI